LLIDVLDIFKMEVGDKDHLPINTVIQEDKEEDNLVSGGWLWWMYRYTV